MTVGEDREGYKRRNYPEGNTAEHGGSLETITKVDGYIPLALRWVAERLDCHTCCGKAL